MDAGALAGFGKFSRDVAAAVGEVVVVGRVADCFVERCLCGFQLCDRVFFDRRDGFIPIGVDSRCLFSIISGGGCGVVRLPCEFGRADIGRPSCGNRGCPICPNSRRHPANGGAIRGGEIDGQIDIQRGERAVVCAAERVDGDFGYRVKCFRIDVDFRERACGRECVGRRIVCAVECFEVI